MNTEQTELQQAGSSARTMGIVTIIFGILTLASPWVAGQFVMWVIGALVVAAGIARMTWAFRADSLGKGIVVFLIGILTLLAGIAVISHPVMTSAFLTIVLAAYFVVDGFTEVVASFALPSGQEGKGWLLFDGIITVVLGFMIFSGFPLTGTLAIGVFLGIKLLLVGMTMLTVGSVAKKA